MAPPDFQPLIAALLDGDHRQAARETSRLRDAGVPAELIVRDGIEEAMGRLDEKCTVEEFNLLEIMLAGRAVMAATRELFPLGTGPSPSRGTVILATLEGDVHDLGKNVVRMVLIGRGFHVVDLGRDQPVENVVGAAEREQAIAVLISGLLTTMVPQVQRVKEVLARRGLGHVKVLAGGAALKQATAEQLNVDYVAQTAFDGAHYLDRLAQLGQPVRHEEETHEQP